MTEGSCSTNFVDVRVTTNFVTLRYDLQCNKCKMGVSSISINDLPAFIEGHMCRA